MRSSQLKLQCQPYLYCTQAHLHSYPMDKMMYDMSEEKQVFGLKDKLGSMTMTFFTKQVLQEI